jgi:hypothetical protein
VEDRSDGGVGEPMKPRLRSKDQNPLVPCRKIGRWSSIGESHTMAGCHRSIIKPSKEQLYGLQHDYSC